MAALTPGTLVDLEPERPVAGGRMLARLDGQVVLVAGAIPGERVRVRLDRAGRVILGSVVEVLAPSPDRRRFDGDPSCGGLAYAHVAYAAQPALKRAVVVDALRRGARLDWSDPLPVHPSPERGYRMRARLHVRGGRVGFFREGSHEICEAAATGQLLEASVPAVERFVAALPPQVLEAVDAVELTEDLPGAGRVVHLSWLEGARIPGSYLPTVALTDGITGVSAAERGAALPVTVAGTPFVSDELGPIVGLPAATASLRRQAPSFFQANRYLLPALVRAVLAQVPPLPVVDLYAGVGLFAVALAARGPAEVTAIEGDPVSGSDLSANAAPFAGGLVVVRQDVEGWAIRARVSPETTLIVDPPRTGLSREALDGVLALRAPRLVYVSCDVATLARDVRRAIDAGYRVAHLEAFDLYPNTAHVETLAVLVRPA